MHDLIIILGGGRDNKGKLTQMSTQRLDKGYQIYKTGNKKILVLGSKYSTYLPNAIHFPETGAQLRKKWLCCNAH